MIRLTIILILFSTQLSGQTPMDYEVYGKVIDDYVDQWNADRDSITRVVVIKKFRPKENYVFDYVNSIYDDNIEIVRMTTRNDENLISLTREKEVKEILGSLAFSYEKGPALRSKQFKLKTPVSTISNQKYKSLFKYSVDQGWKGFYKRHPSTLGVLELSKVEYSGKYACLCVGHHGNGLLGSGDIVILEKQKGNWKVVRYINLWMS